MSVFSLISNIAVIVAGIFCLLWLITLAFLLRGLWKKSRPVCWVSGILLLTLTLVCIPAIGGAGGVIYFTDLCCQRYKKIFNETPTADITEFQFATCDFGTPYTYLKFHANKTTFDRIRPPKLKPTSLKNWGDNATGKPEWMQLPDASEVWMLPTGNEKKEASSETTLMAYDAKTGTVFYYHLGID